MDGKKSADGQLADNCFPDFVLPIPRSGATPEVGL
jgi:hypothetical protein